jgi:tetratricopeptide (TPR) repeat protein
MSAASPELASFPPEIQTLGEYLLAGGALADLADVDRETREALYAIAHHLLLQGQHPKAALLLAHLCLLDGECPRYQWAMALTLREMGRHQEALAHFAQFCLLSPEQPDGLVETARCLLSLGHHDLAVETLEAALTLCTQAHHANSRRRAQALLGLVARPPAHLQGANK